jgi:hypothetical protein
MREYTEYKKGAIRYWEHRRIVFNLAVMFPAVFGYLLKDCLNCVGDSHQTPYGLVAWYSSIFAVIGNLCYSFAYAAEFLLGRPELDSGWMSFGRTTVFVAGTLIGMVLALLAGCGIADMVYPEIVKQWAG